MSRKIGIVHNYILKEGKGDYQTSFKFRCVRLETPINCINIVLNFWDCGLTHQGSKMGQLCVIIKWFMFTQGNYVT